MKRLRTAIIGSGFMGRVHLESIRRLGFVDVVAIASRNRAAAEKLAAEFGVERVESEYRALLGDKTLDAVHVCTPNAQHCPMSKAALEAGKHVLCEKPLAVSSEQARELVELARAKGSRNGLCHNLRYYPMVQHMRRMVEDGDIGEILVVEGGYAQDWLLYDTDWNWRVSAEAGGPSRCLADIGSHWCDMAEHVTGMRMSSLCSDLQTFHETRKQPKGSVETFANKLGAASDVIETAVETEDFGATIFQMGARARGSFTASQVSAGRKNRLHIEIHGSKASIGWSQERPDELWIGKRDKNNEVIVKDPSLMKERARLYADLPGGHSEGYDDTFKQLFRRFYQSIADPVIAPEYPQFEDGLRQLVILEAELQSNRERRWVDVAAV